jgi:phosphonate transport system permease protein
VVLGILAAAAWSIAGLDISMERLLTAPGDAWKIFKLMYPPAISEEIDRGVLGMVFQSVYIAWIGTIMGAVFSLPLSFLAASNLSPPWVRVWIRLLFNAIRAVPELILAVVLLAVTGLGPWAGALAIGLHSIGTLGKWSAEAIEDVDYGPIEAVNACGGKGMSRVRWGVMPQAMPEIVAFWLFRFEINVRASAVLGMIGAGGVGSELVGQLQFRNFPEVGAVLLITVIVVIIIDTISSAARRRIIEGGGRGPDDPTRGEEALADLAGVRLP